MIRVYGFKVKIWYKARREIYFRTKIQDITLVTCVWKIPRQIIEFLFTLRALENSSSRPGSAGSLICNHQDPERRSDIFRIPGLT